MAIKTGTTTLATFSNLNHSLGYSLKSLILPVGTTSISFVVTEDAPLPTCFVIDDVQVTLS